MRRGRLPVMVLAAAAASTACSSAGGPAAAPAQQPQVQESLARSASAVPERPGGVWEPAAWPDACALLTEPAGWDLGVPVPQAGALADGTPLPRAKACRRPLDGAPDGVAPSSAVTVTLTVHLVTEAVWGAWGGVQTLEAFIRPVDGLGDEAFLTDAAADDGTEKLWLCVGRTIVRLERTPGALDAQQARTLLLAVGSSAERALRAVPAGQPADPDWRPAPRTAARSSSPPGVQPSPSLTP